LLPALFLFVLLGGLSWWFTRITARRPHVGKTDPVSGYHYEFSLAQGWQEKKANHPNDGDVTFDPPKPLPIQTWLEKNLFHTPTTPTGFGEINDLAVYIDQSDTVHGMIIQDDFPTFDSKDKDILPMRVLEEKHFFISGQPATWFVLTVNTASLSPGGNNSGNSNDDWYAYAFVVKIKDKPLWYTVAGISDTAHRQQIGNEVRAIRDSFRIKKAGLK
jgi:hypothetical protein